MKKLMLICAPVTSRSGYGAHARDLVRSLLDENKYDIKIQDVRWGDCPRNALDKKNPTDRKIASCILREPKVDRKPDIYIEYHDENFILKKNNFSGIVARVIQHEYDHIQGILFTDKLTSFKKRLLKNKLNNIEKGKIEIDYLMNFYQK